MDARLGRAQQATAMFFDDPATGAEGERGGPVGTFRREQQVADRPVHGWCAGQEFDDHRVLFLAGANEQGGVGFRIELTADLPGKMAADVQELVGIGGHMWQ